MRGTHISVRREIGSLVVFHDLPVVQVWVGATSLGLGYGLGRYSTSWLTLLLPLLGMSLVFMCLMGVNNLFDMKIDHEEHEYSGPITGAITEAEAIAAVLISGTLGLLVAALVHPWFLLFAFAILALSALYSAPPFRFKRYYPVSIFGEFVGGYLLFPLGFAIVAAPTVGCFLVSLVPTMIAVPMRLRHDAKNVAFDGGTGKRSMAITHGHGLVQRMIVLLPYIAIALTVIYLAASIVTVPLGVLTLVFIAMPRLVKKLTFSSPPLRSVSYIWGFLFYLLATAVT